MLAVNVDQHLAKITQLLHGGGLAIDVAPGSAFAGQQPPQ